MSLRQRPRRAVNAWIAAVILLLATSGGASAGRPDPVDPALMTPPLNPSFTWECWRAGNQIVCEGDRTTEYTAVEAIPCPDGGWIYATGSAHDTLRRVSYADGLALSTIGATRINDQMSRSPEFDGIVGSARGFWTDSYKYLVPGDLASRILTRRGVDTILTIPGHGMVVLDAGIKSWDIDDTILFERGPHAFVEDIEGAVKAACDALAGVST
jgi:hypothetical protein